MNLIAMMIINLWKDDWPSWGINKQPPVLKFCTLPTGLWCSAEWFQRLWNRVHFMTIVAFAAGVDQDQAAHEVQPDL